MTISTEEVLCGAYAAFCDEWTERAPFEPIDKIDDWTGKPDLRCGNTAFEMLANYIDERRSLFESPDFRLIACEQPFAVPMCSGPGPIYVGRFDKVFEYQGRIYIGEHKTTTAYKKNGPFLNNFVESFSPNSQIDGYLYASHLIYGKAVKSVWVDAALVHASEHSGFRFIPVERQFEQLTAWHWETMEWIARIEENKRRLMEKPLALEPFLPAFPKNTGSCSNFGQCSYMGLCKMIPNPEAEIEEGNPPIGYAEEKWEPFDEVLLGNGSNIPGAPGVSIVDADPLYDNTRVSSHRSCPRAFYFRHVRHLRPEGTSRALIFGSSWHAAMDVVWTLLGSKEV